MKRNVEKGNGKNLKDKSLVGMVWRCRKDLRVYPGQGTTEYAILVGVLVVTRVQFSQRSVKREVGRLFCRSLASNGRPSICEFHKTATRRATRYVDNAKTASIPVAGTSGRSPPNTWTSRSLPTRASTARSSTAWSTISGRASSTSSWRGSSTASCVASVPSPTWSARFRESDPRTVCAFARATAACSTSRPPTGATSRRCSPTMPSLRARGRASASGGQTSNTRSKDDRGAARNAATGTRLTAKSSPKRQRSCGRATVRTSQATP